MGFEDMLGNSKRTTASILKKSKNRKKWKVKNNHWVYYTTLYNLFVLSNYDYNVKTRGLNKK